MPAAYAEGQQCATTCFCETTPTTRMHALPLSPLPRGGCCPRRGDARGMTLDVTGESRERSACVTGEREFLFCSRRLMRSTDHMGRYNASARFMVPLQRGDAGNIL